MLARENVTCFQCSEVIRAGIDERKYARRGEHVGKSFHEHCYSVFFESESALIQTQPNTNGDGLAAILATTLQPYLTLQREEITEELESRIQEIVEDAIANIPKQIQTVYIQHGETLGTVDGHKHEHYDLLVRLVQKRKHIYLYGEAGSGKSSVARQIAKMLKLDFRYLALQAQMQESRIMGYVSPITNKYVASDFYRCYVNGGVFLLDELELGNDNLIASLNGALANKQCAFPTGENGEGGLQNMHPDFVCIATGNTAGYGADITYSARRALDGSTRDRFCYLQWDTDKTLEKQLAGQYGSHAEAWARWVQNMRELAKTVARKLVISQRASIEGADLLASGFSVAQCADMLVFRGIDANTKQNLLASYPLPIIAI